MMINQLNRDIVVNFNSSFRAKCLTFIADAYEYLTDNQVVTADFDEEQ